MWRSTLGGALLMAHRWRRCPADGAPLAEWRCAQHGPRLGADGMVDGLGAVGAAIARGECLEGAVVARVADFEAKLLAKYNVCGGGPDGDERQESGVECEGVYGPGFGVEEKLCGRLHVRGLHVKQDEDEEREGESGSVRLAPGVWQAVDPEAEAKAFVEGIAVGWRLAGLEKGSPWDSARGWWLAESGRPSAARGGCGETRGRRVEAASGIQPRRGHDAEGARECRSAGSQKGAGR
ncbi:unnamed protein product [Prorocentrum cordatum]|uniref:Uncharacterized protein n=1 Tax=Prorocentrum cordatum TaxID=2364126 RepID=A0ABN9Q9W7_9DINO|nr:unnamed protein product [Polarella glacialis]